jgi:hypothetical protein
VQSKPKTDDSDYLLRGSYFTTLGLAPINYFSTKHISEKLCSCLINSQHDLVSANKVNAWFFLSWLKTSLCSMLTRSQKMFVKIWWTDKKKLLTNQFLAGSFFTIVRAKQIIVGGDQDFGRALFHMPWITLLCPHNSRKKLSKKEVFSDEILKSIKVDKPSCDSDSSTSKIFDQTLGNTFVFEKYLFPS